GAGVFAQLGAGTRHGFPLLYLYARKGKRECRRFEVPTSPAASSFRNFKSTSGTRNDELASAPLLPKFVSEGAVVYHELRKRGTRSANAAGDTKSRAVGSHGCARSAATVPAGGAARGGRRVRARRQNRARRRGGYARLRWPLRPGGIRRRAGAGRTLAP